MDMETTAHKLNETQRDALAVIAAGNDTRCQPNSANAITVKALVKRGLVTGIGYVGREWKLTEAGREAAR